MKTRLIAISLCALVAHVPASARASGEARPPRMSTCADRHRPARAVEFADLNLAHPAGAAALRRRLDRTVVQLSGGARTGNRPDVRAARARARAQAEALIAAARS